jgi:hypothetical protein
LADRSLVDERRGVLVRQDIEAYFEEKVVPLIAREHPDLLSEVSIRVEGSVGLGISDELSDLDVTLFLPEKLWKERGGHLQLTLLHDLEPFIAHPRSAFPRDPLTWGDFRHSEISVHPLAGLLSGKAESVLAGESDVPWETVPVEELLQLQIHPVLRDGHGALARLRELTAPSRYPRPLWIKGLICELADLTGELEAFEKAVRRDEPLEAHMILGDILPKLFRVAFLMNRQYYPWRRCYFRLFKELPFGPEELTGEFETVGSDASWRGKYGAVNRIVRILTAHILKSGMLTADMLKFLLYARDEKAWENPRWLERAEACERQAQDAGYDPWYGWIWDRWGWGWQ